MDVIYLIPFAFGLVIFLTILAVGHQVSKEELDSQE